MTKVIIEGFNVMDVLRSIDQQAKKSQAGLLGNLEQLITDDDLYFFVRKLVLDKMIGILPNTGDSVNEIREIRRKLSKEKFDLNELNKLVLVDLKRLYIEDNKGALGEDEVRRVWSRRARSADFARSGVASHLRES